MALEGQEEGGQRGAEQLAAELITDLPEAFEGGTHGGVIVAPPGSPPEGANRRLPMTAGGPAVLVEDSSLGRSIGLGIASAHDLGVFLL